MSHLPPSADPIALPRAARSQVSYLWAALTAVGAGTQPWPHRYTLFLAALIASSLHSSALLNAIENSPQEL